MANRPAWKYEDGKVKKETYDFVWNPGLAPIQKKRNVKALHESINAPALEVSTKANDEFGQSFSPFNLKIDGVPMESVYHASKKYEKAGPFKDLVYHRPLVAKRDPRHEESGEMIGFEYEGEEFPLYPRSFFFNYLYYQAIKENHDLEKLKKLFDYDYFTDIEFNPNKSVTNQARAVTIIKALLDKYGYLPDLTKDEFLEFQNSVVEEDLINTGIKM